MALEPAPCTPCGGGGEPVEVRTCCAPSLTSQPLCLQDGTPITVLIEGACVECGTAAAQPAVTGWVDLTKGAFTPGAPPAGAGACDQCDPTPMCPQLLGLSGPETWAMPEGAESVSVQVACGPVIITDCAGNETQINECGTGLSWSAPPGGCAPGILCTPFTVQVLDGAAAYINFLAPCDQGGTS